MVFDAPDIILSCKYFRVQTSFASWTVGHEIFRNFRLIPHTFIIHRSLKNTCIHSSQCHQEPKPVTKTRSTMRTILKNHPNYPKHHHHHQPLQVLQVFQVLQVLQVSRLLILLPLLLLLHACTKKVSWHPPMCQSSCDKSIACP
jgi:hypothetical protein